MNNTANNMDQQISLNRIKKFLEKLMVDASLAVQPLLGRDVVFSILNVQKSVNDSDPEFMTFGNVTVLFMCGSVKFAFIIPNFLMNAVAGIIIGRGPGEKNDFKGFFTEHEDFAIRKFFLGFKSALESNTAGTFGKPTQFAMSIYYDHESAAQVFSDEKWIFSAECAFVLEGLAAADAAHSVFRIFIIIHPFNCPLSVET